MSNVQQAYELAKKQFADIGVDTEQALALLDKLPISMHCWQGDDVGGFEQGAGALSGGIQATGNYPGKARTAQELRADLDKAISLIPGKKRLNLHASYLEADHKVDRNEVKPEHFENWVAWAKINNMGLDFNPTYFSHPLSTEATLSHPNKEIRDFWIEHGKACRKISEYFGKELGTASVMNIWIPDGSKDLVVDKFATFS